MKIIDLLNKIANDEEVPEKIKFDGVIYKYNRVNTEYENYEKTAFLFKDAFTYYNYDGHHNLNEEVEILEEEKKIPEKLDIELNSGIDENKVNYYRATNLECDLAFKINEIINYLDFLKSKGE